MDQSLGSLRLGLQLARRDHALNFVEQSDHRLVKQQGSRKHPMHLVGFGRGFVNTFPRTCALQSVLQFHADILAKRDPIRWLCFEPGYSILLVFSMALLLLVVLVVTGDEKVLATLPGSQRFVHPAVGITLCFLAGQLALESLHPGTE